MLSCGCDGDIEFGDWIEKVFVSTVVAAKGKASQKMALSIQDFCSAYQALPGSFSSLMESAVGAGFATFFARCESLVKRSMPDLFSKLAAHFVSSCLESQPFFRAARTEGTFMPQLGSQPETFWLKVATFELPTENLSCLRGMASALAASNTADQSKGQALAECQQLYDKAVLMTSLCSFQHLALTEKLREAISLDLLHDVLPKVHQLVTSIASSVKSLSSHQDDALFRKYVQSVMEIFSGPLLARSKEFISEARVWFCFCHLICVVPFPSSLYVIYDICFDLYRLSLMKSYIYIL